MRSIVALVVVAGCAAPSDLSRVTLPYAIEAAAAQHRPLVIELGATWCKACQVFETKVLPDPRVQAALRDVVFVRYDVDTPSGKDAMLRCRTRGVPAVLGIDHDGRVRLEKIGTEPTADEFVRFMKQAHDVLATPQRPR